MKPNRIFALPLTYNLQPLTFVFRRSNAMKPSLAFKKPLTFHLKPLTLFIGLLFAVFFFYSLSYAQVPQMMNYQGKLTTPAGAIIDTTVSIEFKIYDDSVGGTILWSETQSSARVENGIFSVYMGSVNPIPFDIWGSGPRYLGVTVGTSPEMTPRKPMVSVPYAQHSGDWFSEGGNIYRLTGRVGIGTANPLGPLQVGGGTFIVTDDNWVGIGTTTPQSELDVHGTIRAEHYLCSNGGDLIYPLDATIEVVENAFGCWGIKATGGTGVNDFDWDRTFYPDVVTAYGNTDYPTRNVGIGTTAPTTKVHIHSEDDDVGDLVPR